MPLVLHGDLYEDWLDEGLGNQALNELKAFGFTNKDLVNGKSVSEKSEIQYNNQRILITGFKKN